MRTSIVFYRCCLVLIAAVLFSGCMKSTYLTVLRPADITLPEHVHRVALLERTKPDKKNRIWNIAEGILTGEGIGTDHAASQECLAGLMGVMAQSPRFELVRPPVFDLRGTGTGQFPQPLHWSTVDSLCRIFRVDALVVLEAFDSNSGITLGITKEKRKNKDGSQYEVITHHANMRMAVTAGWRLYDPSQKRIYDQHRAEDYMEFTASGNSPDVARAALISRHVALNRTGFYAGQQYGRRISPLWVSLSRSYYSKGSPAFKLANRKVEMKDWRGAAETWRKETYSTNKKVAGRACYNMAVSSEVEGNLESALEWARQAYEQHNNRQARTYFRNLQHRVRDQHRANEQMRPTFE